jgi:hypothetical protein
MEELNKALQELLDKEQQETEEGKPLFDEAIFGPDTKERKLEAPLTEAELFKDLGEEPAGETEDAGDAGEDDADAGGEAPEEAESSEEDTAEEEADEEESADEEAAEEDTDEEGADREEADEAETGEDDAEEAGDGSEDASDDESAR